MAMPGFGVGARRESRLHACACIELALSSMPSVSKESISRSATIGWSFVFVCGGAAMQMHACFCIAGGQYNIYNRSVGEGLRVQYAVVHMVDGNVV